MLFVRLVISMAVVMGVMALAARLLRHRQGLPSSKTAPGPTRAGTTAWPRGVAGPTPTAKGIGRFFEGYNSRRTQRRETPLEVTYRRPLGRGTWLGVIEASGKRWLIGVTEHSINMLAELPEEAQLDLSLDDFAPGLAAPGRAPGPTIATPVDLDLEPGRMPGRLQSSADEESSEHAWKLAIDSLRERTVRR